MNGIDFRNEQLLGTLNNSPEQKTPPKDQNRLGDEIITKGSPASQQTRDFSSSHLSRNCRDVVRGVHSRRVTTNGSIDNPARGVWIV